MKVNEKIRVLREDHSYSQEDMAEKMFISPNTYGKIERGETRLTLEKLEKIAAIFNISVVDLMKDEEKNIAYQINNNSSGINAVTISGDLAELQRILADNEKFKLIIEHKEEIIKFQNELISQKDLIIKSLQRELKHL